ncbi:MAG: hypothetical protein K6E75_02545 [Lachnospiraceae bacterium]|nr:hypothetical protein [Lachnospiraceae bacterium]
MIRKVVTVFCITWFLLVTAYFGTVKLIPAKSIQKNMLSSAVFLKDKDPFTLPKGAVKNGFLDYYADSILLNLIWHHDSENVIESVLESAYYDNIMMEQTENFYISVSEQKRANQEYLRYWHGSAVLLRPLFLVLDLQGIFVFFAIVLCVLTLALICQCVKSKLTGVGAAFVIASIACQIWWTPFCLEYYWCALWMLVSGNVLLRMLRKGQEKWLWALFLISGMVTAFTDFLTTETLTLTVPLLFWLCLRQKAEAGSGKNESRGMGRKKTLMDERLLDLVRFCIFWGAGYVLMMVSKWGLASLYYKRSVMPQVMGHITERMGSSGLQSAMGNTFAAAIRRNLSMMIPFCFGPAGIAAGVVVLILFVYLIYVYRKKHIDRGRILLLLLVGLIPYLRFLVIRNHSILHYFFTYRAQIATVMAFLCVAANCVDIKSLIRHK